MSVVAVLVLVYVVVVALYAINDRVANIQGCTDDPPSDAVLAGDLAGVRGRGGRPPGRDARGSLVRADRLRRFGPAHRTADHPGQRQRRPAHVHDRAGRDPVAAVAAPHHRRIRRALAIRLAQRRPRRHLPAGDRRGARSRPHAAVRLGARPRVDLLVGGDRGHGRTRDRRRTGHPGAGHRDPFGGHGRVRDRHPRADGGPAGARADGGDRRVPRHPQSRGDAHELDGRDAVRDDPAADLPAGIPADRLVGRLPRRAVGGRRARPRSGDLRRRVAEMGHARRARCTGRVDRRRHRCGGTHGAGIRPGRRGWRRRVVGRRGGAD